MLKRVRLEVRAWGAVDSFCCASMSQVITAMTGAALDVIWGIIDLGNTIYYMYCSEGKSLGVLAQEIEYALGYN